MYSIRQEQIREYIEDKNVVTIKELQALALDVRVLSETREEIFIGEDDDDDIMPLDVNISGTEDMPAPVQPVPVDYEGEFEDDFDEFDDFGEDFDEATPDENGLVDAMDVLDDPLELDLDDDLEDLD